MARVVQEIMNRELFSLSPSDLCGESLTRLLILGVSGAPVVNDEQVPIGVTSFRDLATHDATIPVSEAMSSPAVIVREDDSIPDAATLLADLSIHRAVVVDAQGRAAGIVTTLDLMRALVGMPAAHPPAFPHYDEGTHLAWSDDQPFDAGHVAGAPDASGVIVISAGGQDQRERVLWVESVVNVRRHLGVLLASGAAPFARMAGPESSLRFRSAATDDLSTRMRAVHDLLVKARDARRAHGAGR